MVHLGDPVEDLGWVYRALWSPARSLPFEDFLAAYARGRRRVLDPDHLRWYEMFCEFKHSVISLTAARSSPTAPRPACDTPTGPRPCPPSPNGCRAGGVGVLKPSVTELLAGTADALAATVLAELPPGPAHDQVQAAVG